MAQIRDSELEELLREEAYDEPHPELWITASAATAGLCVGETIFFTVTGQFSGAVITAALSAASVAMGLHRHRRYKRIRRYFDGEYPRL